MTKELRTALKSRLNAALVDYLNSRVDTPLFFGTHRYNYSNIKTRNTYDGTVFSISDSRLKMAGRHDKHLTARRFVCINNLLYDMERAFNGDKELTIDEVGAVKTLITTAISENNRLSRQFGKSHVSYKAGRDLGLNAAAAWWQKTFMQSHANGALEKCLELVETVEARFNKALPVIGSPA